MIEMAVILSIIYLYLLSQYNVHDFNTLGTSNDWFLHPYDGGCCIFGQIMAYLTCILLLLLLLTNTLSSSLLLTLAFLWVTIPYFMNNTWLSVWCIPVSILWFIIAFTDFTAF
jgi:hypothetical protein